MVNLGSDFIVTVITDCYVCSVSFGMQSAELLSHNESIEIIRNNSITDKSRRLHMMNQSSAVKTKNVARTGSRAGMQLSKVGFTMVSITSCAVGIWALACLVGGMVASGGPLALVAGWFTAVTG